MSKKFQGVNTPPVGGVDNSLRSMGFSIRSTCSSLAGTEERTKVKALIKYEVKKSRLAPGTLTHHPFLVIGSLY